MKGNGLVKLIAQMLPRNKCGASSIFNITIESTAVHLGYYKDQPVKLCLRESILNRGYF